MARRKERSPLIRFAAFAATLLFAGISINCSSSDPGADVWKKKCSGCHGPDGKGGTRFTAGRPFADLTDGKWKHGGDRASIFKLVAEGDPQSPMPPFNGRLSPKELDAVVDHVMKIAASQPPAK